MSKKKESDKVSIPPNNGLRTFDKGAADIMTFDLQEFLGELYRVTSGTIIIFCGQRQISDIFRFFDNKIEKDKCGGYSTAAYMAEVKPCTREWKVHLPLRR